MNNLPVPNEITLPKLIDAPTLLDRLFEPACKPTIRWLRGQTAARKLPFVKIGGRVMFDEAAVRRSIGM